MKQIHKEVRGEQLNEVAFRHIRELANFKTVLTVAGQTSFHRFLQPVVNKERHDRKIRSKEETLVGGRPIL